MRWKTYDDPQFVLSYILKTTKNINCLNFKELRYRKRNSLIYKPAYTVRNSNPTKTPREIEIIVVAKIRSQRGETNRQNYLWRDNSRSQWGRSAADVTGALQNVRSSTAPPLRKLCCARSEFKLGLLLLCAWGPRDSAFVQPHNVLVNVGYMCECVTHSRKPWLYFDVFVGDEHKRRILGEYGVKQQYLAGTASKKRNNITLILFYLL